MCNISMVKYWPVPSACPRWQSCPAPERLVCAEVVPQLLGHDLHHRYSWPRPSPPHADWYRQRPCWKNVLRGPLSSGHGTGPVQPADHATCNTDAWVNMRIQLVGSCSWRVHSQSDGMLVHQKLTVWYPTVVQTVCVIWQNSYTSSRVVSLLQEYAVSVHNFYSSNCLLLRQTYLDVATDWLTLHCWT